MGNKIGLGQYNTFYKYIWYLIQTKLISEYFIGEFFQERIPLFDNKSMPQNVIIGEAFNFLGTLIFSLIIFIFETLKKKKENHIIEKDYSPKTRQKSDSQIDYIYNEKNVIISYKLFLFIIILLFLCIELKNIFFIISLKGLDYWIFEIIFVCWISSRLLNLPIYKHKLFSIYFIIIFCNLMKTLSLGFRFYDDPKERLYKSYKWIIPIGIITFILISLLRAYTFCKIKWIMDVKFFSPIKFLIIYGFIGSLICFSISIVTNQVSCVDKETFNDITFFCHFTQTNENNNTIYYYDKFSVFFSSFENFGYVILYIIKIIFSFGVKLFCLLIIKYLSPEYMICTNSIYFFIIGMIDFFVFLLNEKEFKLYKFFDTFTEFFHVVGSIIYLELIELKCYQLDYNLKKNIKKRSMLDSMKLVNLNDSNEEDE